jgi:hypothetical protein
MYRGDGPETIWNGIRLRDLEDLEDLGLARGEDDVEAFRRERAPCSARPVSGSSCTTSRCPAILVPLYARMA